MKRAFRFLAFTLLAAIALTGVSALYIHLAGLPRYAPPRVEFPVDATPERVARGRRTVVTMCAECHRNPETGLLTGRLHKGGGKFGEIYAPNLTQDPDHGIGRWTNGEIAYLIRTGVTRDGRYAPPWMIKMPNLADEDLKDIIAFLRSDDPLVRAAAVPDRPSRPSFLTKVLTRFAFRPLPYPERPIVAPPATDRIAYGRYLVTGKLECYACHSRDFAKVNPLEPEKSPGFLGGGNRMLGPQGLPVYTANLTPDPETGLGRWTEEEFGRALRMGLRPGGRALRPPMKPRPDLSDDEVGAIWAYLRSVPALANAVPAPPPLTAAEVDDQPGRRVYYKYGCNSCHGDGGVRFYDLRRAGSRHPTDESLIAFIRHPERTRPGVAMPTWNGVIEEHEYAPLARFVRSLGVAPTPPGTGRMAAGS